MQSYCLFSNKEEMEYIETFKWISKEFPSHIHLLPSGRVEARQKWTGVGGWGDGSRHRQPVGHPQPFLLVLPPTDIYPPCNPCCSMESFFVYTVSELLSHLAWPLNKLCPFPVSSSTSWYPSVLTKLVISPALSCWERVLESLNLQQELYCC